jgi:AcrR family transcriptional regulator
MSSEPRRRALWEQPRPPRRARTVVDRDAIVAAGLAIADQEGLEAVSMRRIAQRLGAGAMTLYSYVGSKDDLLDLMADAVMGELVVPDLSDDWREALRQIARRTRAIFLDHPWVAETRGTRGGPGPNALLHFEQSLQAVAPLGLDHEQRLAVISVVDDYVFGFVHREVEQQREREDGGMGHDEYFESIRPWIEEMVASGRFPHLQRYMAEGGLPPVDRRLEDGLDWLLDGIAARFAPEARG